MAMPGGGAFMHHSAPSPRVPQPPTPSKSQDTPFEFAVPNFRPNLANFGRKITQIRDDIWAEIGEGDSATPPANPGFPRYGQTSGPNPVPPVKKATTAEDVPGMGDDPVMCPFCDKPLPPSVFLTHKHQSRAHQASRPTIKRTATTGGLPSADGSSAGLVVNGPAKPAIVGISATTPSSPSKRLSTADLKAKAVPDITGINANELQARVTDAAAATASSTGLTEQDLKRWYALAGLAPPVPISVSRSLPIAEKPIPKISPPPPSAGPASKPVSSSLFPFGKNKNADESDEDGSGGNTGYARISNDASDTDEEDKDVLSDEPKETQATAESAIELDQKAIPLPSAFDLQAALREVLGKLKEMSKTQNELRVSQSSLLTSLKIARSNLTLSEANTEMLESQLKQATARANSRSPQLPTSPAISSASSTARAIPGRASYEKQRPTSVQVTGSTTSSAPDKSGSWGFWSSNGKKRMPGGLNIRIPSPSLERTAFDFSGGAPYSALPLEAPVGHKSRRSAESARDAPSGQSSTIASTEIAQLHQFHVESQAKIKAMTAELAELKKGKLEMEAELENLSQALFEEANKMVAEERKKRAEVEETLKHLKDEKEALKATVKVLGGAIEEESGTAQEDVVKLEKAGEHVQEDDELEEETKFVPRDLDKHYEALRKSIHHVADGAQVTPTVVASPSVPTIEEQAAAGPGDTKNQAHVDQSSISPNLPPPTEPNPWATATPFESAKV